LVKLRLKRTGRKKLPIYKIVAADAKSPRDGRFISQVGYYDPNKNPMEITFNETKVGYWLNKGAQPTLTVKNLLRRKGILMKRLLVKRGMDAEKIEEKMKNFDEYRKEKYSKEKAKKLRRAENKKKKAQETKEGAEKKAE
jgi:small subunit ribosomal protein S16